MFRSPGALRHRMRDAWIQAGCGHERPGRGAELREDHRPETSAGPDLRGPREVTPRSGLRARSEHPPRRERATARRRGLSLLDAVGQRDALTETESERQRREPGRAPAVEDETAALLLRRRRSW